MNRQPCPPSPSPISSHSYIGLALLIAWIMAMLVLSAKYRREPLKKVSNPPPSTNQTLAVVRFVDDYERKPLFAVTLRYGVYEGVLSYAYSYTLSNHSAVFLILPASEWERNGTGCELRPRK